MKALDGQGISTGPNRYSFTKRLLTGDTKAIFNLAALDIGIHTVNNSNKIHMAMTKHTFSSYTFCKQQRYI